MINFKIWKDDPDFDKSGFDDVHNFLQGEGAKVKNTLNNSLYKEYEYTVSGGGELDIDKLLKKKFPDLADIRLSDATGGADEDGGYDEDEAYSPMILDIKFNNRGGKKKKKKEEEPVFDDTNNVDDNSPLKGPGDSEINNEGEISVDPKLSKKGKKDALKHELRHKKAIDEGRLSYDDDSITYNGEEYDRRDGLVKFGDRWLREGTRELPWELEAFDTESTSDSKAPLPPPEVPAPELSVSTPYERTPPSHPGTVPHPTPVFKGVKGDVKGLQTQLKNLGLYEGKVDGKWGKNTQEALAAVVSENPEGNTALGIIPANVSSFIEDQLGVNQDEALSNSAFTDAQLEVLRDAVDNARKRGSTTGSYKDYEGKFFKDSTMLDKLTSDKEIVKTTLGGFSFVDLPDGRTIVIDQYNFNSKSTGGKGLYGFLRDLGGSRGSEEGDGRPAIVILPAEP